MGHHPYGPKCSLPKKCISVGRKSYVLLFLLVDQSSPDFLPNAGKSLSITCLSDFGYRDLFRAYSRSKVEGGCKNQPIFCIFGPFLPPNSGTCIIKRIPFRETEWEETKKKQTPIPIKSGLSPGSVKAVQTPHGTRKNMEERTDELWV